MKLKGLTQAALVTGYCALVGYLIFSAEKLFDNGPNYFGPVTFLLLFCTSALICALLVFYKPYLMFFANKKKEAIELVLYTAVWLFVFFVVFLLATITLK